MDSPMLKMLKSQNPDKEYPSNIGLKWFEDEETILLEELKKNTDIEIIAQNHNRTRGGINSRRKEIAYKMYLKNILNYLVKLKNLAVNGYMKKVQ